MYSHTVRIEQKTQVSDGGGGFTTTWVTVKDWDCDVVPVGGREYYVAQQMTNPVTYNVNGDYDGDIKPSMRVVFGPLTKDANGNYTPANVLLNIEAVIPTLPDINGDYEFLTLNCSTWNGG